jgi:hypothetical protein
LFKGNFNRLQNYPSTSTRNNVSNNSAKSFLNNSTISTPILDNNSQPNLKRENFVQFYPPPIINTIQNNIFIFLIIILLLFIFFKIITIQNELKYTIRDLKLTKEIKI